VVHGHHKGAVNVSSDDVSISGRGLSPQSHPVASWVGLVLDGPLTRINKLRLLSGRYSAKAVLPARPRGAASLSEIRAGTITCRWPASFHIEGNIMWTMAAIGIFHNMRLS